MSSRRARRRQMEISLMWLNLLPLFAFCAVVLFGGHSFWLVTP